MSSLKYWIWLSSKIGVRATTKHELINAFGDPEAVYFAEERVLTERLSLTEAELSQLRDKSLQEASEILEACQRKDIGILTIADASYPKRLKNIYDPPVVLYIRGKLPFVDELPVIGMVGTRKATPYGIKIAKMLGEQITAGGGVVVTGLAGGVDSASAEGALTAGGSCIGVLGCAIDEVYPAFNTALYRDVMAVGALVSEYPPGTQGDKSFFPRRNRIISGLSVGVTIIEAPRRSGSLITASHALEQGREVFAVPGNIDAPNCAGSNRLIREGATLVTCGWDVLSEFEYLFPDSLKGPDKTVPVPENEASKVYASAEPAPAKNDRQPRETGRGFVKLRIPRDRKNVDKVKKREYIDLKEQLGDLTETQLKIVSVMDTDGKHIDDIIDASGLPVAAVMSEMTILQVKGYVVQESGKRFSLNISKNNK